MTSISIVLSMLASLVLCSRFCCILVSFTLSGAVFCFIKVTGISVFCIIGGCCCGTGGAVGVSDAGGVNELETIRGEGGAAKASLDGGGISGMSYPVENVVRVCESSDGCVGLRLPWSVKTGCGTFSAVVISYQFSS